MWGWIVGLGIIWILLILALFIAPLIFWILKIVRLAKNEDKTGMWVVFALGLFLTPLVGWLVGLAFKEDNVENDKNKEKDFWCGICNIKYKEEFCGGETAYEGKVCRSCLGKKQRGEATSSQAQNQRATDEPPFYMNRDYGFKESRKVNSSGKKILLRELNRKQSKKNSHLTSFIINLFVLQWLFPLIIYLFFWIQLKETMKVQALNNPGARLTSTIPFSAVIKDFFKILSSETFHYGGHKIVISFAWKIGIVVAFLLPLVIWIYSLVRFFGAKGETERLETEIREL